MNIRPYKNRPLYVRMVPIVGYLFILNSCFVFIRMIGAVVKERENRNIENLENMGMKKIHYFLATILWKFSVQVVIGSIFCGFLKINIFPLTNYFLLLLIYCVLILNMQLMGFFISCFFIKSKKAIVVGIIYYFGLQLPYIFFEMLKTHGTTFNAILAISPFPATDQIVSFLI